MSSAASVPKKVIFACVHNAGRSRMAETFFNALADPAKAQALSAGTEPGLAVHSQVSNVMDEVGLPIAPRAPQRLTEELAQGAALLVTLGCGESCPVVPGAERLDWPLADPKGLPLDQVREVREEVRRLVEQLLAHKGWR